MRDQRGFTMTEIMVMLAVIGIALSISALYLKPAEAPLHSGVALFESFLRQGRMQAMANTSAFRISPASGDTLQSESAVNCSASTWTAEEQMAMPEDVSFTSTAWSVCFSSRGIANNNVTVTLSHPDFGSRQIEVLLGGTTREL